MPKQGTEQSDFVSLYEVRQGQSIALLARLDELERAIRTASSQQTSQAELRPLLSETRREFSAHLGDQEFVDPSTSRRVVPIWLVSGVPAKRHKDQAVDWMKQRGSAWDGSAPSLRHAVRSALTLGEPVPERTFGLHVERTIEIQPPRAFTVNLLGTPHHVVESAGGPTNPEAREEKLRRGFFRGED